MSHDIIVVGQRRDRVLGEPDAEVSVRCRTCNRILWQGTVLDAGTFANIVMSHHESARSLVGEP